MPILAITCYDKCLGCSNLLPFPKSKFDGGETAPEQFSFRHHLHSFVFIIWSFVHCQYVSDALDLCQLLHSPLMVRDSSVHCGADLKSSQSQWKGSQWFQWTLDPSHPTARLGCILHTLNRGAVSSTRCTTLHCCACSRLKIQLWRAALFTQIQTWTLSSTALAVQGQGWRSVHMQEADGMPEFVSQMQQSTMMSGEEDKQNSSKQGNL